MADKKRSQNFSSEEILKLMDVVKQHKEIVECKKTDAVFSKKKVEEWEKIAEEFNSTGTHSRSAQALRTKFENVKKTTKKKFAAEKQQIYATGGGVSVPSQINSVDEAIYAMLPTHQISGFESIVDCDSAYRDVSLNQNEKNDEGEDPLLSTESFKIIEKNAVKRKNSAKQNGSSEKWQKLADLKIEAANENREQRKEQHELTIANMKLQHNLEMEVLELEKKKLLLQIEAIKC